MAALVVHQDFPFAGKLHKRGEVLFGEEADAVALSPFARMCAATSDGAHFDHLRPAQGAPTAVNTGFMAPSNSPQSAPETVAASDPSSSPKAK